MRFRAFPTLTRAALAGVLLFTGASQALAEETSPCFTGDGTIKAVLEFVRGLYRLGLDRQGQADHRA